MTNNKLDSDDMDPLEEDYYIDLLADIQFIKDALLSINATETKVFSSMKGRSFGFFPLLYNNIESVHDGLFDADYSKQLNSRFMTYTSNAFVCHNKLLVKRNSVYVFGSYIHDIITPDFVLESILDPGFYILPVEMYDSVLEILSKNYYEHI